MTKPLTDSDKKKRINLVKRELESKEYITPSMMICKHMKDYGFFKVMKKCGVVKQDGDNIWHWNGGENITKAIIDKIYSSKNSSKSTKVEKVLSDEPKFNTRSVIDSINEMSSRVDDLSNRVFNPVLKKTYEQDSRRTSTRIADIQTDVSFLIKRVDALTQIIQQRKEGNVS